MDQLARRLVARGILREQDRTFLWVFHDHRFPTDDPGPESSLRGRIRDVALGAAEPDPRTLLLLSLVNACNLADAVFSRGRANAGNAADQGPGRGRAVRQGRRRAIADAAAATAAVSTAAFTTTVAPGASH